MEIIYRRCYKCRKNKPLNEFTKSNKYKFGRRYICKICSNEYVGKYLNNQYKTNIKYREKIKNRNRENRKNNKSKRIFLPEGFDFLEDWRNYRKQKYIKTGTLWCSIGKHWTNNINFNKQKCGFKGYNSSCKPCSKTKAIIYLQKQCVKDNISIKRKKNYKANPILKFNKNIRNAIASSLKGNKNGSHWEDIVGYTLSDLKKHLEKKFTKGMSWENHGEWHIDHIIPISKFNFTKPEHSDFKKCWALKNLQPLWALENIKKSNNLIKPFQPSLLL